MPRRPLRLILLYTLLASFLLYVHEGDARKSERSSSPSTPVPASTSSARDDHPVIQNVRGLRNTAMKENDRKNFRAAIEKLREALTQMHDRVFGEARHTVTNPQDQSQDASLYAQLLNDYGSVLIRAKEYDEAIEVLNDAITMMVKIYGESHPSYGLCIRSLADAYMAKKEYHDAITTYKKLRKVMKNGLGVTHEAYIELHLKVGEAYKALDNTQKAVATYTKVLKEQDGQINVATNGIAEVYMELASMQQKLGNIDAALEAAETARAIFKEREGTNTINYAFSLNALAGVKMSQGKVKEAYKLLQKAHKIALRLYGKSHEIVRASAKTLTDVKERLDELKTEGKWDEL